MRRGISWLLTVPLVLAGSELAHGIAYWTAVPDARERARVLAATGHGYFAHAPLAAALGLATVLLALALHAGGGRTRLRAWPFAVLPLVTFTLQEHLERLIHGANAAGTVLEPTFVRGALLQIPFGIVAYFIARALLRVAERIGAVLRGETATPRAPAIAFSALETPFQPVLLVAGCGSRGPPARL